MGNKKDLLSIGEASKYIGVSRDTLRRWEKKGKVTPSRSPTNRRYYTKQQLDALIKKPNSSKSTKSKVKPNSLKLAIYSLAALLIAVIIGLVAQLFVF
jgi:excisionase family DNA binding protein